MRATIIIGFILFSISTIFAGIKIERAIYKTGEWKIQKAYMDGIAAKPLPKPEKLKADTEYIFQSFYSSEDCSIEYVIYPYE